MLYTCTFAVKTQGRVGIVNSQIIIVLMMCAHKHEIKTCVRATVPHLLHKMNASLEIMRTHL